MSTKLLMALNLQSTCPLEYLAIHANLIVYPMCFDLLCQMIEKYSLRDSLMSCVQA